MAGLLRAPGPTSGLLRMELAKAAAKAAKGSRTPGLLADAADEAMFAAAPNGYVEQAGGQYAPQGLLSSQPARPSPQDPPKRDRVSGWRVFDRVLGGQTVSEGLDAERARMAAEAQRPLLEAQKAETLASITDPTERALFMQAPDVWAENAGHRLRPRTLAPGSVERVNGKTVGAAPIIERVDDRFGIVDPLNPASGAQYTDPRGATFAEETGRINATNPVPVAPGVRLTDPYTGRVIAEGADRVFSAGEGSQLYTEQGGLLAENAKLPDPADAAKAAGAIKGNLDMVGNTRRAVARAREQIGAFSTGIFSGSRIVGGTPAANLQATIDTIEANLSFQELAKMRANSPTGGALGGIALRELELLGATVASLRQSQSQGELEKSMKTIDQSLARYEEALRQAQQQGGGTGSPAPGAVEDGYRFKGGNPADPNNWERVR